MNTFNKNFLLNHGFQRDTNNRILSNIFTNNKKFKEVNISVDFTEPPMLLARNKEKNVIAEINSVQDNRLILKKRDKHKTVITNILLDEINDCLVKDYGNGFFEFEFEIRGFCYSLHVLI